MGGKTYIPIYKSSDNKNEKTDKTPHVHFSWNPHFEPIFRFYNKSLTNAINDNDEHCCHFFTLLYVCHTVLAEEKIDKLANKHILTYQAQSPDEEALVSVARNFSFVFKSRTPKTITVLILGEEKTFEVLNILDFNNDR